MTLAVARHIVLAARPQGTPHVTDFRLEDTALPTPAAGQLLLGMQYLSLDPYMRLLMDDRQSDATPLPLGEVMPGEAVAQVFTSHHPAYAAGDLVLAPTGWRTHALSDGTGLRQLDPAVAPVTTALGVLGMPGFTAYAGVRLIGTPRPRDTVVVAAASGPVGSLVGQLAQLAGRRHCRQRAEMCVRAGRPALRRRSQSPCHRFSSPPGGGVSQRDRRVLRECRRRDLAGGAALAQPGRARPWSVA